MSTLNHKQKLFVKFYLKTGNATLSAVKAGYSKKTAAEMGYENLRKPHIAQYLSKRMSEIEKKLGLSKDWVLERLASNVERCRQAEPVLDKEGNVTGEYKFDAAGSNKALELLGRHYKMFTDRTEHEGTVTLSHEEALRGLK